MLKRKRDHAHFIVWTALGAAMGAMLREWAVAILDLSQPWVIILAVNVIGSFIIAIIYEIEHVLHRHIRTFGAIGFCGGFTTFSHFSNYTVKMLLIGESSTAFWNILLSMVGTFFAVFMGIMIVDLAAKLRRRR